LRFRPWALDFTPDDSGAPPYPFDDIINPYFSEPFLEWSTDDWDPALRFWTLPYDVQLTEWLKSVHPARPSIMAAREFGGQAYLWHVGRDTLLARKWLEADDVSWQPDETKRPGPNNPGNTPAGWAAECNRAWAAIIPELEELKMLMEDDRDRYLAEIEVQADGLADYIIAFIGASEARRPWTIELISCGLAIGNIAYMSFKQRFRRVRPSVLCPGLIPPFGPPQHPSFPSGHSFLGHFIALLLLEIPAVAKRFGIFDPHQPAGTPGTAPTKAADLSGRGEIKSPLLWLAQRLAKGRERLGVHYPSDSSASRHLAAGVWYTLLHEMDPQLRIYCPTLETVLRHAIAEWS
jgi:hypothetical protein